MSVMNLGLEALGIKEEKPEVLSYEYLDAVIEYSDACDEMNIVFDQFDTVLRAAQNLEAVKDVIAAQGVTPALEALVGGNFKGGLSLEAIEASMEAADGAIIGFIKKIWAAIKQFFLKLFSTVKGMRERLEKFAGEANAADAEVTCMKFNGIKPEMLASVSKLLDACKQGFVGNAQIESMQKLGEITAEVELGGKEAALKYATDLGKLLNDMEANKATILKNCDVAADEVQKKLAEKATDEERKAATEEAKAAKDMVNKLFKSVMTTAAAFLSHTKVGKKAAEKPAEGEEKK
jgi:hypothetical protein